MSMLAEKKRREKWSLNPRGKAWSEDQSKFGQRLLEKMGWKTGQGLGANSQGQTEIVKTRVKNDSKGLGFKENGEEWLKTTSDFDNLLDELASSQEDNGDGSQTETRSSLEDRSKKSRARVHYHKFTRGKDLSRYSEKDLASIIGPDVIKLKNGKESKSDYTQNQVNKGSLEEYFGKKLKSKESKSADNIDNNEVSDDFKETVMNSESKLRGLDEDSENFKIDPELEVTVSSKKKKRKKTITDENVAEVNSSLDFENCKVEDNQHNLETEVSGKKKKKRKSGCDVENSLLELEENDPNGLNSATSGFLTEVKKENENFSEIPKHEPLKESSDVCQTQDVPSKKRKRKDEDLSQDVENFDHLDNAKSQIECDTDEKTLKKKKRKNKGEETVDSERNDICINNNSVIPETVVNKETVPKMKKKKLRDENKEQQEAPLDIQTEYNKECTTNNLVIVEETVVNHEILTKNKKKKSRDGNKNDQEDSVNVQTKCNEENSTRNPIVAEEAIINDEIVSKKKKKKSKDKNKEHQDDSSKVQTECNVECMNNNPVVSDDAVVNGELVIKKKKKKSKDENQEHPEESLGEEQTVIKKKHKQEKENKQLDGEITGTNEIALQCKQEGSHDKSGDYLKVLGRKTRLKNIKNIRKTATDDSYKTEDFMSFCKADNSKKEAAKDEDSVTLNTEDVDKKCVYIYRESNSLDCSINKDVLSYENKLVTDKLAKLKMIKKPCIVITDSQNLNKSTIKKLEEVHRVRYYKEFLSEQDISEINVAVKKFRESCTNYVGATSKDVNQNSVIAKPKPVQDKAEKKNKTTVKKLSVSPNSPKIAIGKNVNKSKLAKTKEVEKSVNNEKANYFKCYAEANTDDCNVPKHVVAHEYRLVTARLKRLEITPPEVKVVVKESSTLNESTRRKLKQIAKIRHLKTLLPPNDLTEVEALVAKFYDQLKPKIELMTVISELEEKILEIAENLDGKPELNEEVVKVKSSLSEKVEAMTELFQKLETLLERFRKTKDESSTSEGTIKENSDAEDAADQSESRCSWLKKVEDKLDILKKHMKMLAKGEKPPGLNITRESQTTTKNKKEQSQQFNSYEEKNHYYQSTSYSRGRIAYNASSQRGRGRGIGRSQSVAKSAVPSGGWGILKSYGSGTESGLANGSQNCRGGFGDARRFMGRGRGFSDGGGFSGQGRGFSGVGGFMGRGRGSLRGRGVVGMRGRGRISQNNFDAKLYAEKCKELNKVPEVCFNGVNMKVISGYPANVNADKNSSSSHDDSKFLGNQSIISGAIATKESGAVVNTIPGVFSEVVVRKDGQSGDRDQVPKNS